MGLDLVLKEVETSLPQALNQAWPLVEKARAELGIPQTKVEMSLGNLQFSGETPITWISQCAAQAEKKANALHEAYWRLKKQKLKIKKLRDKDTEESNLKADEMESGISNSEHYIKTAYKDLMHYQKTMEILREKHNLPAELSEEDLTENSKKEHIRKAMRQALRDVQNTNSISKGVSEHLEHYGIHPMTARLQVDQYMSSVHELFKVGKAPTMDHLHIWLNNMEMIHYKSSNEQLRYMGLMDNEINEEEVEEILKSTES
jgi:hypothetical protein